MIDEYVIKKYIGSLHHLKWPRNFQSAYTENDFYHSIQILLRDSELIKN
jgi:hypothetical protein